MSSINPTWGADFSVFKPATLGSVDVFKRSFHGGGVSVLGPPALDDSLLSALASEAEHQFACASWKLAGSRERGEIEQDNRRAHVGPVARAYLSSPTVSKFLYRVIGEHLEPCWSATCFTRYEGPGDHMGEHCDKELECAYGLLTYLNAQWPCEQAPSAGMRLFVFRGNHSATELVASITARANRVVLLHGSRQAHLRPPMASGEHLTLLAGCFRRAESLT